MTVMQAQCLLMYLDYPTGTPDDDAGPKTRMATSDFQSEYGLPETGQLDDAICKMLVAAVVGMGLNVE